MKIIAWVISFAMVTCCLWAAMRVAYGNDGPTIREVSTGVMTLQPSADLDRADELAEIFHQAGRDHDHDPLLLVAIAFRESSLKRSVELRQRFGDLGEYGLMQTHGAAVSVRPSDCDHHLVGARCQVQTGAAWLSYAREQCGGSWWRWIGAYGRGKCPSERMARQAIDVKRAHRYYVRIGGTKWR